MDFHGGSLPCGALEPKPGPSGSAGGDKPRPYITALEDILRRGRHPRAASLAPAGQFAFCPHRPAAAILHPRRRGGPCGRPSSPACRSVFLNAPPACGRVWAPAPTSRRGGRPTFRAPRVPGEAVRVGKGGPAAGVSVRACPEANDPKLGPTLSRCGLGAWPGR